MTIRMTMAVVRYSGSASLHPLNAVDAYSCFLIGLWLMDVVVLDLTDWRLAYLDYISSIWVYLSNGVV